MSSAQQHNRKRVWVHRLIQGRVLTNIAIYWVLYHVVLWHAMFLHRFLQYREGLIVGQLPVPFAELYGQFVIDHIGFVVCAGLVLPIVMWDALCFSHRIVGPLHRIKTSLQQLARGELIPRVRLRKKDFLGDLAGAFNDLRDRIASEVDFDEAATGSENIPSANEPGREEVVQLELASTISDPVSSGDCESVCIVDSEHEFAVSVDDRALTNRVVGGQSKPEFENAIGSEELQPDEFNILQEIWDLQERESVARSAIPAQSTGSENLRG
ncbi:MAG: HAMP domain-containing protein [Planctomycetaceae bacterium]